MGTALLYGDAAITPAISVLSAVEGAQLAAPGVERWVVPIAVVILIGLFAIQRRGTSSIGRLFGPVMTVWFAVISLLGIIQIVDNPQVLRAVNPVYAVQFFTANHFTGFLALGSVFLVVTGGEALYADMGHFGRRPIAMAWFVLVLPALLLNYFGQGALLLSDPSAIESPLFEMAPDWSLYPMVLLATAATIIASQALISGIFSLTMQAIQLGYAPRHRIRHMSDSSFGQVYLPVINWALMGACIAIVVGFRSSSALASAYGVAVTSTMVITTILFYAVLRDRQGWSKVAGMSLCGAFLVLDVAFFGANLFKIPTGGWFPIIVAGVMFTLMTTWHTGRRLVAARIRRDDVTLSDYLAILREEGGNLPQRVEGTAVYLFSSPGLAPPALMANVQAQPLPAQSDRRAVDHDGAPATGTTRGSGGGHRTGARDLSGPAPLRVHGGAGRHGRGPRGGRAGSRHRSGRGDVRARGRDDPDHEDTGHGALAGAPVRLPDAERDTRGGVLRASPRADDDDLDPGRPLGRSVTELPRALPSPGRRNLAVRVTRDAGRQIRSGHPWVFDASITSVRPDDGAAGDLAVVFDSDRRFMAVGLWDPASPIRIKVLHHGAPRTIDESFWQERIDAAVALRRGLAERGDTDAYRVIHGENDGLPGLVVDRYASISVVKLYSAAWFPHLGSVLEVIASSVGTESCVLRLGRNVAAGETFGLADGDTVSGPPVTSPVDVIEHGLTFRVDVVRGQKTGHFLDQRDNRARVGSMSRGRGCSTSSRARADSPFTPRPVAHDRFAASISIRRASRP